MGRRCAPHRMESRWMTEHRRWPCRMSGRTFHIPVSRSTDRPILENHSTRAHGYSLLFIVWKGKKQLDTYNIHPSHSRFLFILNYESTIPTWCFASPKWAGLYAFSAHPTKATFITWGKKDAMAEWNTEILPSITGQSSRSRSSDVISAFLLSWSKRKRRANLASWGWSIWTTSASRDCV